MCCGASQGTYVMPVDNSKSRFRDLPFAAAFVFAAEKDIPGYQGALGPWVKVGQRSYRELRDGHAHGPTHLVGNNTVSVYRTF
jgi:hypothetical protein